jgi:flagellar protein FliO/FliZ
MTILLAAQDLSLTTLVPRLFISMAVVIGLMWLAARVMKNRQFDGKAISKKVKSSKPAPVVEVVARQGLSKGASITIVRVGGKELVLGVTDSNISLLAESGAVSLDTPNASVESTEEVRMQSGVQGTGPLRITAPVVVSNSTRKGLLESVREMTVRK